MRLSVPVRLKGPKRYCVGLAGPITVVLLLQRVAARTAISDSGPTVGTAKISAGRIFLVCGKAPPKR